MKASWVSESLIFVPVEGGFYLVNAFRASQRVLYEALLKGRARPLLLAPKAPWPPGLEERLPALQKLGINLARVGKWAVPETWPEVPWSPRAHQLREALAVLAKIPPLNLDLILQTITQAFPYPSDVDPEPLVEALFQCAEPEKGPFGGLTAAFYSWEELSTPLK